MTRTIPQTRRFLSQIRQRGMTVGLAPTMGALHRGHISLVDCAVSENDATAVTIFVNPTQFNDPADLERYPRNLEGDLEMLKNTGCDLVFIPDVKTIYPEPDLRKFDFGGLDKIMEGKFRPGHFNGVAQVVSRLFDIIKPDRAYFGEKDFQQIAIIREMIRILSLEVEVRSCPTLRESDGLAMSSRNVLLKPEERKNASLIYLTLQAATLKKSMPVGKLREWVTRTINSNPYLELEYFEILDGDSLKPLVDWRNARERIIACIAVRAGQIRLIDNIFFPNFA